VIQFFYALIAFFSWGTEGIFDKKSLEKLNPHNALSVRYFFVFLWVILAAVIFTEIRFPSLELIPYLLFTCLIGSTAIIFFFKSINEGTLSLGIGIAKNYFLVTMVISVIFFQETLSLNQIIAALLILCSLFLLSFDRKEKNLVLGKGVFFALLTVLGWGAYFALIKPIVLELNPFNASLFLESIIFLMILIYSVATKKELKLNERKANYFAFGASILLVIGSIAYNFSVLLIGAGLTAMIVAPTPVLVSVLARVFLKEKLSVVKYLAILVSVSGLILLFL
jgi:drug/metabolite transporter (DMT)-like permease